jgi:hypothetical protein
MVRWCSVKRKIREQLLQVTSKRQAESTWSEPALFGGFSARFPFRVLIVSRIFCVIENHYVHMAKAFLSLVWNSQIWANFCLMLEGPRSGSGSIQLTNGSGSGSRRPKNMWIRWIRILIRNTAVKTTPPSTFLQLLNTLTDSKNLPQPLLAILQPL